MVNYEKSMFMVSRNTSRCVAANIESELHVTRTNCMGQYLGLPSQTSRNKCQVFNNILNRVWQFLQGWKEKLFSSGGKEVLIKAVAQAIPNYSMSCFRFPMNLCKEINSLYARFWWGSNDREKKIHWPSWKRLCVSKEQGGLGFKDLCIFNQAMLAKQSWQIIKNPNSLLVRVLRGKYFKHGNFMTAELGSNPSFVWRSILWGKELFVKGIRWRIGNGFSVIIGSDPWILREGSSLPF
ncbi:uncharacterized protein LOC111014662 [Momordica charantia]|uniref:Uncharacterized protein LOC111014662 n=1 Tax=Momordica charantia TaxID=3673 RepID=A0A6J1CV63_MOMCH|nr:uncharacterized protein LOC111014662 [Momordica charantia]